MHYVIIAENCLANYTVKSFHSTVHFALDFRVQSSNDEIIGNPRCTIKELFVGFIIVGNPRCTPVELYD